MQHFLIHAFGSAHIYTRGDHHWVGAVSREDGDRGAVALLEDRGRPVVVVCGGWLYPRSFSHRAVDVTEGAVLWTAQGTTSTQVIPIRLGDRTVVSRAVVGKWGNSRGTIDPLTGAPVREAPPGFSGPGRLIGSPGGRLYAILDGEAGTLRVYRDGAPIATVTAPTDPAPTVTTARIGGQTYLVSEAPIVFSPRMATYLDDEGGVLTAEGQTLDAYGLDGAHTRRLLLPEETRLAGASWADGGWLLLLKRGEQALVSRMRDGAVLLERPASRQLGFAYGAILRDGLGLTDVRTGAALPPLVLPAPEALLGRLELDAPGIYGDRLVQIVTRLLQKGRVDVDPMLQRFDIVPRDVRRPARRAPYSAGPVPVPGPMRRALERLARWTRSARAELTASALAAHDAGLDAPLPAEALPLFASGLRYLMEEGSLHPDRRKRLLRYTDDIPADMTPLAAFLYDFDTEIVVTWAYRYAASGAEFFRVESIRGSRGSGIRREAFSAVHVTGPLPLHSLVSEAAGQVAFAAREAGYFFREPDRPPVAVTCRLG